MGGLGDFFHDTWEDVSRATAAVATGGLSEAVRAATPGTPGAPPPNPATDPAAQAERDRVAREEQIRRLLGGRESTVQTSPMGIAGAAPVATKSLLGS